VTTHDILRYLQERANLFTVTSEDLALILGDHALEKKPAESSLQAMNWTSPLDLYHNRTHFNSSSSNHLGRSPSSNSFANKRSFSSLEASLPSALRLLHQQQGLSHSELDVSAGGGGGRHGSSSPNLYATSHKETYLDRVALRQVLSDPAHHNLATLLHRFASTQVYPHHLQNSLYEVSRHGKTQCMHIPIDGQAFEQASARKMWSLLNSRQIHVLFLLWLSALDLFQL
jgi:hypothetical protein